jgi:enoyl-CoA hydratase/carnithine racemase
VGRASLEWDGDVAVIRMQHEENRFHPEMLEALNAALGEVEERDGPAAVVLTGEGKFFSNGLDLDYMGGAPEGEAASIVTDVQRLFARVLGFPTATIAALNGHVFAAGAMLALACDQRVMREDRGFFCLPEVDLGIPFTPGMNALITSNLSAATAREAMLTGRRYGGTDALQAGIVDAAVSEGEVVSEATARAAELAGKPRHAMAAIKARLYEDALSALETASADLPGVT